MAVTPEDFEQLAADCERLSQLADDERDSETLGGLASILRFEAGRKRTGDADQKAQVADAVGRLRRAREARAAG